MFQTFIKKLPIIRAWQKCRRGQYSLTVSQQQLLLAIKHIEEQGKKVLTIERKKATSMSDNSLIVSLTSYGERINTVHLTIQSILLQSVYASKVILWLAESEFTLFNLPKPLVDLQQYGLTIRFCEDIRSYKKLIPTLKAYPNTTIVTFDDDVIYPANHLEKLLEAHEKFPEAVICHRAHRMIKDEQGNIVDYLKWQFDVTESTPVKDIFPIGIGGVLYPANCFDEEVLNEDALMRLAPSADDLWFKVMASKKGRLTKVVDNPMPYNNYLHIPLTQAQSLWQNNQTNNDTQLHAILASYPTIKL